MLAPVIVTNEIPKLIDEILTSKRWSERALAMYMEVSSNAVNAWRRGLRRPDPNPYCWKLAELSGRSIVEVMRMAEHLPEDETDGTEPEVVPELRSALRDLTPGEQRRLVLAAQLAIELREERVEYDASPPEPEHPAGQTQ